MAIFSYRARDESGANISGLVEAPSDKVAARLLREKHLFVIKVAPAARGFSLESIIKPSNKISFADTVNFTRQMATLSVAGLSLPESLSILRSQTKNQAVANLYLDIENTLVGGGNLATALGRHGEYFQPVYIALVRAGEASGSLDKVLGRMAETLENQLEFRAKLRSAMVYPTIIIIGMGIVVFVMMTFVIPKLTDLYKDFGVTLPLTTQILVSVSQIFVNFWWLIIIGGVGGYYLFQNWKKSPFGQLVYDSMMLKMPIFGDLQSKVILAEFTRTLGMLIGSGIHILDAMSFLKDSTGNILFKKAITDISKKIEKGFPMGESFGQYAVFPLIVSQMVKVGEETGKLDETLNKLSIYFERDADHMLKNLTTALEPMIMVILGLGVGFIVFSIITPIYSLTSQIK